MRNRFSAVVCIRALHTKRHEQNKIQCWQPAHHDQDDDSGSVHKVMVRGGNDRDDAAWMYRN